MRRNVFNWSRKVMLEEYLDVLAGKEPSLKFKLANRVMNKMKAKIGFQNVEEYVSGAAPLLKSTRDFFLSVGIYINNIYGLSETTGGITGLYPWEKSTYKPKSCGKVSKMAEM